MAHLRKPALPLLLLSVFLFLYPCPLKAACPASSLLADLAAVPEISYEIKSRLPHDPDAFTQGLLYLDGLLYESTGRYGASSLRIIDPLTGTIRKRLQLPATVFGEGLASSGRKMFQLSWKEQTAFVYRLPDLTELPAFSYVGEGWGLTADDNAFYMSDGSAEITIRSLADFSPIRQITVHDGNRFFTMINELEMAEQQLYANIWQEDVILRIDPASGEVTGYIDTRGLFWPGRPCRKGEKAINGIAYNKDADIFYLTGKNWPFIFLVKFSQ